MITWYNDLQLAGPAPKEISKTAELSHAQRRQVIACCCGNIPLDHAGLDRLRTQTATLRATHLLPAAILLGFGDKDECRVGKHHVGCVIIATACLVLLLVQASPPPPPHSTVCTLLQPCRMSGLYGGLPSAREASEEDAKAEKKEGWAGSGLFAPANLAAKRAGELARGTGSCFADVCTRLPRPSC